MLDVSPLYAGLIALLFIALSFRVVQGRMRYRVSIGDGGEADMERRIRVQANCAEYAPLGLILLGMAELQGMPGWLVHLFGAMLFLGRVLHAWGMGSTPPVGRAREWGMYLTVGMIVSVALANIGHAIL